MCFGHQETSDETCGILCAVGNESWNQNAKTRNLEIFLRQTTINGGEVGFSACITGHKTRGSASREGLPPGVSPSGNLHLGGSASRGFCIQEYLHPSPSRYYRILSMSGGTHPTGMHSCSESERAFRIQFQRYIGKNRVNGAVTFQFLRYSDTAYRIVSFTLNEELAKFKDVGASSCHDSLIFMSTHKATAARCLSHHQATYGLPPSAWPL